MELEKIMEEIENRQDVPWPQVRQVCEHKDMFADLYLCRRGEYVYAFEDVNNQARLYMKFYSGLDKKPEGYNVNR